jgi:hypothetical protein
MLTVLLMQLVVGAAETPFSSAARLTGGVVAPASLPAGTTALYGYVGAPEVGAGYRQGFGAVEFDARAAFNLFEVAAVVEAGVKIAALEVDRLRLAPTVSLGVKFDSGARYFDRANFAFIGLRPKVGLTASYAFTDTISGIAQLEIPWSIALTVQGFQVTPLAGAGAEFHLGGPLSLLLSAHVGFDATKEPLGVVQYRVAWAGRLGLGWRLF